MNIGFFTPNKLYPSMKTIVEKQALLEQRRTEMDASMSTMIAEMRKLSRDVQTHVIEDLKRRAAEKLDALDKEARTKSAEYQRELEALGDEINKHADQEMAKACEEIATELGLDAVIPTNFVYFYKPEHELTERLMEHMRTKGQIVEIQPVPETIDPS